MTRTTLAVLMAGAGISIPVLSYQPRSQTGSLPESTATVPMVIDHNRAFVEAEFRTKAAGVRRALLWIDTGNPDFIMTADFARDIGIDVPAGKEKAAEGRFEVPPPGRVRIGGLSLEFGGVKSNVLLNASADVGGMRFDANLPSTVLRRYDVVLDYPAGRFTLAAPGTRPPRGTRLPAAVHPHNNPAPKAPLSPPPEIAR